MPTYQYACTECGHQLEAVQSFSDPALTECPSCQGRLRKVFNSVGIVFKGSGFYRNDSRSGTSGTDKPAGTSEAAKKADSSSSESSSGSSSGSSGTSAPAPAGTSSTSTSSSSTSSSSGGGAKAAAAS